MTNNPSTPHTSKGTPARHVDINGPGGKTHQTVKNHVGATAIYGATKKPNKAS